MFARTSADSCQHPQEILEIPHVFFCETRQAKHPDSCQSIPTVVGMLFQRFARSAGCFVFGCVPKQKVGETKGGRFQDKRRLNTDPNSRAVVTRTPNKAPPNLSTQPRLVGLSRVGAPVHRGLLGESFGAEALQPPRGPIWLN